MNAEESIKYINALKLLNLNARICTKNECVSGTISNSDKKFVGIENDAGNYINVPIKDIISIDAIHTCILDTLTL